MAALMHGYLHACFPQETWNQDAHRALQLAAWDADLTVVEAPGLFSGLGGLAFAANYQLPSGERYRPLTTALESILLPATNRLAQGMLDHPDANMSVGAFDVISGLSGVGAYLLCRRTEPGPAVALLAVLRGLVALTCEDNGLPHWHTPANFINDDMMRRQYPNGQLNCGLAHGVPGILAVLALAELSGVSVAGMPDAIERIARWLGEYRCDDAAGVNWPNAVPLDRVIEADGTARLRPAAACSAPFGASRSAWCYGPPGVARALWLAGVALDDARSRDLAVAAMEAIQRRSIADRHIDSATFCHGVAGLLQVTLRFAHDTGDRVFVDFARALTDQLLGLYDPATALGYRNLEPGGQGVDQPGLLDGAAGIPPVLLAAATDVEPSWDRLFLLS